MDKLGVEADLKYPDANSKYKSPVDFLTSKLLHSNASPNGYKYCLLLLASGEHYLEIFAQKNSLQ